MLVLCVCVRTYVMRVCVSEVQLGGLFCFYCEIAASLGHSSGLSLCLHSSTPPPHRPHPQRSCVPFGAKLPVTRTQTTNIASPHDRLNQSHTSLLPSQSITHHLTTANQTWRHLTPYNMTRLYDIYLYPVLNVLMLCVRERKRKIQWVPVISGAPPETFYIEEGRKPSGTTPAKFFFN